MRCSTGRRDALIIMRSGTSDPRPVARIRPRMKPPASEKPRCPWARTELYIQYHDTEWGVPLHEERLLFEFLILEGAQAGLSWETILNKRENYRAAFDRFDPVKVARYD